VDIEAFVASKSSAAKFPPLVAGLELLGAEELDPISRSEASGGVR
jgi:hypothetical protein